MGKQLVLFKDIPFVDEVEEFNSLMNKPNNYEPTIPEKKNGSLYTTSYWKNLRNIEKRVNEATSLKFWMLCVTLLMFPLGTVLCYMVLRIKFGQPIKRYKHQTYQKLAQLKKKQKQQWSLELGNKGKPVTMKSVVINILFTDRVTEKL
jgi:hypothetical protein